MTDNELVTWAIGLYTQIAQYAVPIGFAFGMSNLIVTSLLTVAFGGRLVFRGGEK